MKRFYFSLLFLAVAFSAAAEKKIVLIAGNPSHGPGEHEHRAGCLLLKSCLDKIPGVSSIVYSNGWPQDKGAFEGADTILIYADARHRHPVIRPDRLLVLGELMKK